MNGASLITKAAAAVPPPARQGVGVPTELFMPLVNLGAVGVVLAWFMLRAEAKFQEQSQSIDRLRQAVNRLAMAHLLEVATREDAPTVVRKQAEAVLDEIKTEQAVAAQGTPGKGGGFLP